MSTEIKSTFDKGRSGSLSNLRFDEVNFVVYDNGAAKIGVTAHRKDFIAAVEKELVATVILHSDLPEVEINPKYGPNVRSVGVGFSPNVEDNLKHARAYLAVALYLEKNPPVDEKQVEAVQSALQGVGVAGKTIDELARALVQQGVRVEVTE